MRILIEGEQYSLDLLESILSEKLFIKDKDKNIGIVTYVGYYYYQTPSKNELIYILPKVFIDESGMVLSKFSKEQLLDQNFKPTKEDEIDFFDKLHKSILFFYKSLLEYKKRIQTNIINKSETSTIEKNIGDDEYTYLDIVLNIVNFHKKNQRTILFIEKKQKSYQYKKPSWNKTINKSLPIFQENKPIYIQSVSKRKIIDTEETLMCMFYSVVYHLKKEYRFNIIIDDIYKIHKGAAFHNLCQNGLKILRRLKYKYFSDTLINIYRLLELYFSKVNNANVNKQKDEYILVNNYNLIFEDMIDKLFSDSTAYKYPQLKNQKDEKIIDHIFEYNSLIDSNENIFYVGDSKYYKISRKNEVEEKSKYKQFTYVKNIIQYSIDIKNGIQTAQFNCSVRYRDEETEGYSISPNFFIQGRIDPNNDFKSNFLIKVSDSFKPSYQFENRLFDRDTLFLHNYNINFLFVLRSYSLASSLEIHNFQKFAYNQFRVTLIKNLNTNYKFYKRDFISLEEIRNYLKKNFKQIIGKCYIPKNNNLTLIFAIEAKYNKVDFLEDHFLYEKFLLS